MGITAVALDLDQTTLNRQGRLCERNRRAIEYAIQKGIHIIVASGRPLSSLPAEIRNIREIRYAITSNGAAIYDLHTEECLKQYKMTESSIDAILRYTEGLDVTYEAFIGGKAYAQKVYVDDPVRFGATPRAIPYIQSTREPIEDIRNFIKENQCKIESIDIVVKGEEQKLRLWRIFEDNIKDVYITSSVTQLLEISYKGLRNC